MKKTYIVTDGVYSDFHIVAAFSTRKKAENFMSMFSSQDMQIEEFELDETDKINGKLKYYQVEMRRNGDVMSCELYRYPDTQLETVVNFYWDYYHAYPEVGKHSNSVLISDLIDKYTRRTMLWTNKFLQVVCLAEDDKHAIKIANEIRTREIAQNNFTGELESDEHRKFIKVHDCKLKDIYDFDGKLVPFDLYEEILGIDEKMPNSMMLKPLPA